MIRQNLHMHTVFDDGKDTCRGMLEACLQQGITSAGISLHSPLPFENDWSAAETAPFLAEMRRQKEAFEGRLTVYTGIEMDVLSTAVVDDSPFDYVIGSVHHLPVRENPPGVDHMPEVTARLIAEDFGGDADAAAEMYFRELLRVAENPRMAVCGHFDLLTKFDEKYRFFDPESPRYRRAALYAMDALCDAGKIFEVNTGAISRGWRSSPYPSTELLRELRKRNGRVTVSSDAHSRDAVACAFPQAEALLLDCGFTELWVFDGCSFVPEGLNG
ncbi:MAG: histidinol-phosphatase HisJ family protein [Clostridia bacterium]|nr:histidinol-phosphatase HisJ family protein [Clostridia bacterium]